MHVKGFVTIFEYKKPRETRTQEASQLAWLPACLPAWPHLNSTQPLLAIVQVNRLQNSIIIRPMEQPVGIA